MATPKTVITKTQATEKFLNGAPFLVVEYRSSRAEMIEWRDKETKAIVKAGILTHTVENAGGTITVNERTDASFAPEAYVPQFKKGDKCLLELQSLIVEKGVSKARGVLHPVDITK